MTPAVKTHNLQFIACHKPAPHPVNTHLLAIDTRGMPYDMFQDVQQALLDVGLRYHLQAVSAGQLLCFDRKAFELLCKNAESMPPAADIVAAQPRTAAVAE